MHPMSWAARCRPTGSSFHPQQSGPFRQLPGPGGWGSGGGAYYVHPGDEGGPSGGGPGFASHGGFGVRRPLRFLAYKLELTDPQVAQLARVLDELKTERAQADVDDRRTLADFADAVGGEAFDAARAAAGADRRLEAARRLREAVLKALGQVHAILTPDQRGRLAYLIRTGVLTM